MPKTKAQITEEIEKLKKEKIKDLDDKVSYENALKELNNFKESLFGSCISLKKINSSLKRNYEVNGKSIDNGKVDDMASILYDYYKKINNDVISAINKNINDLSSKISLTERKIASLQKQYLLAES